MGRRDRQAELRRIARERILVLDGAWGTLIHGAGLQPADYRGARFARHPVDVAGDPDVLNLTRPDVVREIHEDARTALLVPLGSREALGRSLALLVADAELRAKLGAEAKKRAQRHSIEPMVDAYEALYRERS